MAGQTWLLGAQAVSPSSLKQPFPLPCLDRFCHCEEKSNQYRASELVSIQSIGTLLCNPSSSLSPMFFVQSKKESPPNECECLSHASETYATLAGDSLLLPVSFTGVRNGILR